MFLTFTRFLPLLLLSLGVALPTVVAQNLTSTTCTGLCQSLLVNASTWEASQKATGDYSFYDVPTNFSKTLKPGALLRVEYATNLTNYTVPSGLTMSRILYTTSDLNGTTLPASAYILWPYALCKPSTQERTIPFGGMGPWNLGFSKDMCTEQLPKLAIPFHGSI